MKVAGFEAKAIGNEIKIGCKTFSKRVIKKILEAAEKGESLVIITKSRCWCGSSVCTLCWYYLGTANGRVGLRDAYSYGTKKEFLADLTSRSCKLYSTRVSDFKKLRKLL